MALWVRRGVLVLLAAGLMGCGKKDEVTGPKPSEITGVWNATKFEYVRRAPPNISVDMIAAGGTAKVWINLDKSFMWVLTWSGADPDTATGTWQVDDEFFTVFADGAPNYWIWRHNLSGNSLTLTGAGMVYDFDGVGGPDPADHNMVLAR